MKLRLFSSIAVFVISLAILFGGGSLAPTTAIAGEPLLPIVYVHGGAGSAAQYETQAMRWDSNNYPNVVTGIDRTSSSSPTLNPMLDAFFDAVMAETGDNQIYVVAHSLGTSLMVNYLNSSPARSARVAKYINIDGATGASCPGNPAPVKCMNLSRNPLATMGPINFHFTDHGHTQCVTSDVSFIKQYEFLTGKSPKTTLILPEPPGQVEIAGRLIDFPANTGVDGATLEIWEVHGNSGVRKDFYPMAIINLDSTGEFGPIKVNGQKHYEFAAMRPDSERVTHYYRQPFIRSNYLIRLLSSPPTSAIITNTEVGPDHSAGVIIRYKEWWSDQDPANDTMWVTTRSPSWKNNPNYPPTLNILSNSGVGPRAGNKIGIHAFDAGVNKISTLAPIPYFVGQIFQTGVDIWMPATEPPDGTISFTNEPRGDTTRPQTVNVTNWASDKHRISIQFNDYVQDINTWGECKRAKPSPCK